MAVSRAHAQSGGPPLLFAFTCGWMTLDHNFLVKGETGKVRIPATCFLIDHPKGLVIFDTGLGPRFIRPAGTEASKFIDFTDDSSIDKRLEAIGVDPASINWVINSHLHMDHAGGNSYLPNATIIVQQDEWDYAAVADDTAYRVSEYNTGQPLLKISGEHDLFGDGSIVIFRTPGHTPGHQSARVRTASGEAILAADCCNMRKSLDELRLPDECYNAEQYLDTLKRLQAMRQSGMRVFYSHDPDEWVKVPQGEALTIAES
jgi:N-acyl homoserine lactone hydrolase